MPVVKNLPANERDIRDVIWIPGLGRSPEGGNGNLLQDSGLENPMEYGPWGRKESNMTEQLSLSI